ncbi:hypothetical protein D7X87_18875 [bacterium D16-54]|nr:hypothetical protein D7X87_18875 [bacterium D16-54]RKJ12491.1 hypothetical protein D7X65_19035 [bacterium D16-56]
MQNETLQEGQKEKTAEKKDAFAKYTVKDSVFTTIFRDKKYLIQLYRALHPEDTETTEDALTDITIRNVLTNGIYNDLAFRVGEKVMFLVEQQSLWTMNIIIRALLYLAQTYHDYFEERNADLYGSKKVHVPEPEIYVIFTGERASRPECILLSEEFFGGKECAIEVKVKVLYGGEGNDIISQYVAFTKVYNEQMRQYGRSREAVTETIRICKDRDVLREFLAGREKEVISIMMALFDEEKIMRTYVANERREAVREAVENMLKTGKMSAEEIAGYFKELSVEDVREIEKGLLQTI